RLFIIGEAFRRGYSVKQVWELSKIDYFFLNKFKDIVDFEKEIASNIGDLEILKQAKEKGFADITIAKLWNMTEQEVYDLREKEQIMPVYKMVDTCAAEFDSATPYFYGTYEDECESVKTDKKSILVLGSGPIRI